MVIWKGAFSPLWREKPGMSETDSDGDFKDMHVTLKVLHATTPIQSELQVLDAQAPICKSPFMNPLFTDLKSSDINHPSLYPNFMYSNDYMSNPRDLKSARSFLCTKWRYVRCDRWPCEMCLCNVLHRQSTSKVLEGTCRAVGHTDVL